MIGIVADVLAVVLGGLFGTAFREKMSTDFTAQLNRVFGVCAMGMGISSIVLMENMPAVVLAVVVGTAIGLAIHLNDLIRRGSEWMEKPVCKLLPNDKHHGTTEEEYRSLLVTGIVLFCSSGTGIYGSLDAGMTGNVSVLMAKSVLDFFTAIVFACSLGAVVSVIAIPQFAIFSLLFVTAWMIGPLTAPEMINDFRACGGFLLLATGFRIAKMCDFPLADMIPAMVLVMPFSSLWQNVIVPLL